MWSGRSVVDARDLRAGCPRFASRHSRWAADPVSDALACSRSITPARCEVAKAWREGTSERSGCPNLQLGMPEADCNPARSSHSKQSRLASLFRGSALYFEHHRAPRLLSVTESVVLPPRPRGGYYVRCLQIQYSRVAGASGTAADLFCAADRCCDAYSVVVPLGGPAPSARASGSFRPMKRAQSSLACKLNIRAADALDRACKMPPGDERAEAMKKATILENAAEMLEHFGGKVGVPAK